MRNSAVLTALFLCDFVTELVPESYYNTTRIKLLKEDHI